MCGWWSTGDELNVANFVPNFDKDNTQLAAQDLSQLKVDELTPLTPIVISRQATINIGARACGRSICLFVSVSVYWCRCWRRACARACQRAPCARADCAASSLVAPRAASLCAFAGERRTSAHARSNRVSRVHSAEAATRVRASRESVLTNGACSRVRARRHDRARRSRQVDGRQSAFGRANGALQERARTKHH